MTRAIGTLLGAIGGGLAILFMLEFSVWSEIPLVLIPFATSIVLTLGSPEADAAQPRAILGGHFISTIIGLLAVKIFGPHVWVAAIAVGASIGAMRAAGTFHPPAGIGPLIVVLNDMPWSFLLNPVLAGAIALVGFSFLWQTLVARRAWPRHWI
jgi:CBS-domain-containing membrane protein